jgi:type I restriction enzyme, S subunit
MSLTSIKMCDVCEITSSKRIFAKEYIESGVPFFRGKEVVEKFKGAIDVSTKLFISENRFDEIKNRFGVPQKGDLLLTSVGTIGVPYLVDGEFDFYFKDGNLTWFRDLQGIDSHYLYYWIISPQGKAELSKCTIGAAQPAYTINRLKEMAIRLPDEPSQIKISAILRAYDESIKNNRRRIQLLEESARLLYKEWFVQLRFPGHEHVKIIDGVPEGWMIKPLSEVAIVNEQNLKKGFEGKIEYVDIASVSPNSINQTAWYEFEDAPGRARRVLNHKDVVWSCVRPNRRSHALVWAPHDRLIASTGFAVITAKTISPCYIYQYVTSNNYVGYLTNNAGGAAYPAVTAKVFEKSDVLVPTESLQIEFESFSENIYQEIQLLSEQNKKLTQARDILLPRLMNGTLTV